MKILSINKQFNAVKLEGNEEQRFLADYTRQQKALTFEYNNIVTYGNLVDILKASEEFPKEFDIIFKTGDIYPNHNKFEGENITDENWCRELGGSNRAIKIMSDAKYTFRTKSHYTNVRDCIESIFNRLSTLNILIVRK